MSAVEKLESQLNSLLRQRELTVAQVHQIDGAIAVVRQMLGEAMREADAEREPQCKEEPAAAGTNGETPKGRRFTKRG